MTSFVPVYRRHVALRIAAAVTLVAGCSGASGSGGPAGADAASASPSSVTTAAPATPHPTIAASPSPPADRNPAAYVAGVPYVISIHPSDFTTTVTNRYFPLDPGTTWTFDGAGEHVVVSVTDQTRMIAGVTTVVVHDQALEDGEVIEDTEDYYAQDAAGNVWYLRRGHR